MGGQDHARLLIRHHLREPLEELTSGQGVERRDRLVEEEQLGVLAPRAPFAQLGGKAKTLGTRQWAPGCDPL